ncbi:hypothetical protein ACROYT_G021813 [Oculina patagonica]
MDLMDKMEEYLGDSTTAAYNCTLMKARLQEQFGDQIIITEINGKPNVVTFRSTASAILHEFHSQQKDVDLDTEKLSIIRTASRLIKNDIELLKTSNEVYPLIETEKASHAKDVFGGYSVDLAVQLHHNFASRFQIDTPHRHGFYSSYQELQLFNKNAALDQGTDIPDNKGPTHDGKTPFMAWA